jgi:hypothetical protein
MGVAIAGGTSSMLYLHAHPARAFGCVSRKRNSDDNQRVMASDLGVPPNAKSLSHRWNWNE